MAAAGEVSARLETDTFNTRSRAFYAALAKYTRSPEELAQRLEQLEADTPQVGGHA